MPPEGAVFSRRGPPGSTAKAATLFEPGLTARTVRPLSVTVTAPWDARPPPVPIPPAKTLPAGLSEPLAAFEIEYAAPTAERSPAVAAAANARRALQIAREKSRRFTVLPPESRN